MTFLAAWQWRLRESWFSKRVAEGEDSVPVGGGGGGWLLVVYLTQCGSLWRLELEDDHSLSLSLCVTMRLHRSNGDMSTDTGEDMDQDNNFHFFGAKINGKQSLLWRGCICGCCS